MKKIISSICLFVISVVLFAQTNGTAQSAAPSTKGKASAGQNQIAVSDPGTPNKNSAKTSNASSPNDDNKPKGGKEHSKRHKK